MQNMNNSDFVELARSAEAAIRHHLFHHFQSRGQSISEPELQRLTIDCAIFCASQAVQRGYSQPVSQPYQGVQQVVIDPSSPQAQALFGRVPATVGTAQLGYSEGQVVHPNPFELPMTGFDLMKQHQ